MLYVTWGDDQKQWDETWYVGTKFPSLIRTEDVKMVSADGDELMYIINHFVNLPYSKGSVTRWTGEFARFIYENMRLRFPEKKY